jgi:hypothetical protein
MIYKTPIKNLRIEQYELTKTSHKRGKGERDCNQKNGTYL